MAQRFAVDKMLGRLATWLRLIGQDATYGSHLAAASLVRHARTERRTVLTRDHRVVRAAVGVSVILIVSDDFREQLVQVMRTCHLDPDAALFTRCTACNTPVICVPKPQVAGHVPPYVFATQEHFVRCAHCRRIYWRGTHYDRVREQLRGLGHPRARVVQD